MAATNTREREEKTSQFGSEPRSRIQDLGNFAKEQVKEQAAQTSSVLAEKARQAGSAVTGLAGEAVSELAGKAREVAATAFQTAGNVASTVGQTAQQATSAVGTGIKSLGGTVRENLPHSGMLGTASSTVAETLENTGQYVEEQGLTGIGRDVTNLIRRNPIPALFVGVFIGYMIARITRS
jgi:hypothetical protein